MRRVKGKLGRGTVGRSEKSLGDDLWRRRPRRTAYQRRTEETGSADGAGD